MTDTTIKPEASADDKMREAFNSEFPDYSDLDNPTADTTDDAHRAWIVWKYSWKAATAAMRDTKPVFIAKPMNMTDEQIRAFQQPGSVIVIESQYEIDGCPVYSGEEQEGMLNAFNEAQKHKGMYESLFAVATYIMRKRGYLSIPKQEVI